MFVLETQLHRGERGEDRLAVERMHDASVLVVADGAGGTGSGGAAAEEVCSHVVQAARDGTRGAAAWCSVLQRLDDRLSSSGMGGQSTVVVVEVMQSGVCGASIGDTEAWLISEARTVDLTSEQVRKPLLGTGQARPIPFGPAVASGRLLVATDGLFGYGRRGAIESAARTGSLREALTGLASIVVLRSGAYPDDLALALGEWTDHP